MHFRVLRSALLAAAVCPLLLIQACGSNADDLLKAGPASTACKQSSECGGSTPVCDPGLGTCVQCLFETQCAAGQTCSARTCITPSACASSLDCAKLTSTTVCDPGSSTCVQCVAASDCTGTADCVAHTCQAFASCKSSNDCAAGLVCVKSLGRCLQCDTASDCGSNKACVGNVCKDLITCQSDNQCTPLGKLCDKAAGMCVDCLTNAQCADAMHCQAGGCVLDLCQAGASKCEGNAVTTCSIDGAQWSAPVACSGQTTCQSQSGVASCKSLVCQPSSVSCQGDKLITCASDGMSVASTIDCASQGLKCVGAACSTLACVPNAKFCKGLEVWQCNAQGTSSQLLTPCGSGQTCDTATATCLNLVCTPGQPACNGTTATVCLPSGTGYESGVDCAAQGKSCQAGTCVGCPGTNTPDNVRFGELFIGNADYVVLDNRGACPAELDSLHVWFGANDASNNVDYDIPPRLLAPGERVYVIDSTNAKPGDLSPVDNIFFVPDAGGFAVLCKGLCASNTVLDYVAQGPSSPPPTPPSGITFTPSSLTDITIANQEQASYMRVQFNGASPTFLTADWQVGTASHPWVNPAACPSSQPTGSCTDNTLSCAYGPVFCSCQPIFGWLCQ